MPPYIGWLNGGLLVSFFTSACSAYIPCASVSSACHSGWVHFVFLKCACTVGYGYTQSTDDVCVVHMHTLYADMLGAQHNQLLCTVN